MTDVLIVVLCGNPEHSFSRSRDQGMYFPLNIMRLDPRQPGPSREHADDSFNLELEGPAGRLYPHPAWGAGRHHRAHCSIEEDPWS